MKRFLVFGRSVTPYSQDKVWTNYDSFDERNLAEMYITIQKSKNKQWGEASQQFYIIVEIDLPEIPAQEK